MKPVLCSLIAGIAFGQVSHDRIVNAAKEPGNWLTHNGGYNSTHYRDLTQMTPDNASQLQLEWVFQANSLEKFETTPLVVDGTMYITESVKGKIWRVVYRGK